MTKKQTPKVHIHPAAWNEIERLDSYQKGSLLATLESIAARPSRTLTGARTAAVQVAAASDLRVFYVEITEGTIIVAHIGSREFELNRQTALAIRRVSEFKDDDRD